MNPRWWKEGIGREKVRFKERRIPMKAMKKLVGIIGPLAILAVCQVGSAAEQLKQAVPAGLSTAKAAAAREVIKLAAAGVPSGPTARAKQLIMVSDLGLIWLDPGRAFEGTFMRDGRAMYEQLTDLDTENPGKIIPQLAEKWEISSDGRVYAFQLRKGVKFSTGREMTSEDVKFSLDRLKNLKTGPSFVMGGVDQIDVVDPRTVRFTLEQPDASLLARLACISAGIIDSAEAKAHGATSGPGSDKTDQAEAWLNQNSIGTGAYVLERWERNAELRLKANPNYWRGRPGFDVVIDKAVLDPTTQAQMLVRGDADIALNLDADRLAELRRTPGIVITKGLPLTLLYIGMTAKADLSPIVANGKFRQAVSFAIDYEGLINMVGDSAVRLNSLIPRGLLGADTVPPLKRDLAKAKALLAEAGYASGSTKLPLMFQNVVLDGVDIPAIAQKVQADLAMIGVTVELVPQPYAVFTPPFRAGKYAMVIHRWNTDYPDSHAMADSWGPKGGLAEKRLGYYSPENEKLARQAIQTVDPNARIAIYSKYLKNVQDDANFVSLVQPQENIAHRDYIKGFKYHPYNRVPIHQLSRD
jgi:peptide/nickel transport system substrate-binding protein